MINVIGIITTSIITSDPLFEQTEPINVQRSAMEYTIAASMITRSILVVVILVVRVLATVRSIFQMRYASNPNKFRLV